MKLENISKCRREPTFSRATYHETKGKKVEYCLSHDDAIKAVRGRPLDPHCAAFLSLTPPTLFIPRMYLNIYLKVSIVMELTVFVFYSKENISREINKK